MNKKLILELYFLHKCSLREIERLTGTKRDNISKYLKSEGVNVRQPNRYRDEYGRFVRLGEKHPPMVLNNHHNWKNGKASYRKIAEMYHKKECFYCKNKKKLDVHHKDHNRNNNKPDNLRFVCRSCHLKKEHPYILNKPRDDKGRFKKEG